VNLVSDPATAPEALKDWRKANELSQEEAGKRMPVTVAAGTWCDWEPGNKVPTVDRAEDLEKVTGGAVTVPMWAEFSRTKRAEKKGAA
jgi:transcriptional regulator with XRE-family HTH domain